MLSEPLARQPVRKWGSHPGLRHKSCQFGLATRLTGVCHFPVLPSTSSCRSFQEKPCLRIFPPNHTISPVNLLHGIPLCRVPY